MNLDNVIERMREGQRLRPKGYLVELAQKVVEVNKQRCDENSLAWASRVSESFIVADDFEQWLKES